MQKAAPLADGPHRILEIGRDAHSSNEVVTASRKHDFRKEQFASPREAELDINPQCLTHLLEGFLRLFYLVRFVNE